MSSVFERVTRRGDNSLLDDVTLKNQQAVVDGSGDPTLDEHGNIVWDEPVTSQVAGEIVYRGDPQFSRRADGIDRNVTAMIWVSDPDVIFTDANNDRSRRATRVVEDDVTYVIREVFDEKNGRRRGHAVEDEE